MAKAAGLSGKDLVQVAGTLHALYRVFRRYDAILAEINPLARTSDDVFVAVDAKVDIDDSAVSRHPDLDIDATARLENALERRGR